MLQYVRNEEPVANPANEVRVVVLHGVHAGVRGDGGEGGREPEGSV